MGSRKKNKPEQTRQRKFWELYKQLNIHQRIAFKQFWMAWGRMRLQMYEFETTGMVYKLSSNGINNCVHDGYIWLFTCMQPYSDHSKAYFANQHQQLNQNLP